MGARYGRFGRRQTSGGRICRPNCLRRNLSLRPLSFSAEGSLVQKSTHRESRHGSRDSTEWAIATRSPCDESRYCERKIVLSKYCPRCSGPHVAKDAGNAGARWSSEASRAIASVASLEKNRLVRELFRQRTKCE